MDEKGFEPSSRSLQGWYVSVVTTRPERLAPPADSYCFALSASLTERRLLALRVQKLDRADSHRILKAPVWRPPSRRLGEPCPFRVGAKPPDPVVQSAGVARRRRDVRFRVSLSRSVRVPCRFRSCLHRLTAGRNQPDLLRTHSEGNSQTLHGGTLQPYVRSVDSLFAVPCR